MVRTFSSADENLGVFNPCFARDTRCSRKRFLRSATPAEITENLRAVQAPIRDRELAMKYQTGRKLFAVRRNRRRNDLRGPAVQISQRPIGEPKALINVSHDLCDWRNKFFSFARRLGFLGRTENLLSPVQNSVIPARVSHENFDWSNFLTRRDTRRAPEISRRTNRMFDGTGPNVWSKVSHEGRDWWKNSKLAGVLRRKNLP